MNYYSTAVEENKYIDSILKWIVDIVLVIMLAFFVLFVLGKQIEIKGNSMSPSLENSDKVLVNQLSYGVFSPKRFDVIMFNKNNEEYVKRIVGLPGETIQIQEGYIWINDEKIDYPYNTNPVISPGEASSKINIGENEFFVMGDNFNNSEDSRFLTIGNIKRKEILGKIWYISKSNNETGFLKKVTGD